MTIVAWFGVAITVLSLVSLAVLVWLAVVRVNEDLGLFMGLEGDATEVWDQAARAAPQA